MQCLHHNHSLFLLPVQVGIFPVSTWSGFKFSPMSLPPFHYLLEAAQTKFRNLGSTACIPSYKTCAYFFPPSRHQTLTPPLSATPLPPSRHLVMKWYSHLRAQLPVWKALFSQGHFISPSEHPCKSLNPIHSLVMCENNNFFLLWSHCCYMKISR